MKGHNNPPASVAFALTIEELMTDASSITAITNDDQEAVVDAVLTEARKLRKDADAKRAAEKKPHMDAAKAVDEEWKPNIGRCDLIIDTVKGLLTPYREARQRAKDEAARLAREEADARQREAQEALRASDDLTARFAAEEQLKAASKLTAQANRIDRAPTGLRTRQVAEVDDYTALLKHIKATDPEALKRWLSDYAQKVLPAQLPGVTIRIEKRAA